MYFLSRKNERESERGGERERERRVIRNLPGRAEWIGLETFFTYRPLYSALREGHDGESEWVDRRRGGYLRVKKTRPARSARTPSRGSEFARKVEK